MPKKNSIMDWDGKSIWSENEEGETLYCGLTMEQFREVRAAQLDIMQKQEVTPDE